jgi:phosphonate transport system substrate-binding protein
LIFIILQSCKEKNELKKDPIRIDFSKTENETYSEVKEEIVPKEFKVAISAIISPREGFEYYKHLIEFLEDKTGIQFKIVQRETYQEVNLMLRKNNVNLAFICSVAYVVEKRISDIEILAVPLTNGKPYYQSYIIAIKRLHELGFTEDDFFAKTTFSNGHDNSIQLVSKGLVDGATVDGLIYDYLYKYNPERISNLKIIETSEYFGIPPVVVPKNLDLTLKNKIKSTLLNMHLDTVGKEILNKLLIDKFIEGKDEDYNSIRAMENFIK